jgi:hypothetical protein
MMQTATTPHNASKSIEFSWDVVANYVFRAPLA